MEEMEGMMAAGGKSRDDFGRRTGRGALKVVVDGRGLGEADEG